jgi:PIN domain nuclease of toxin-antitoxin system
MDRCGRLDIKRSFSSWVDSTLAQLAILEAPFNIAVAKEVARIQLPQPDLGDIFLAATASALGLTLVTADSQLLNCTWLKTLANE